MRDGCWICLFNFECLEPPGLQMLDFLFCGRNRICCEWYTKYTAYVSKYKFQFLRLSLNYIKQLGLKDTLCKRERPARLDFPTNISLVPPMSTWKGEGFYVELSLICPLNIPIFIGIGTSSTILKGLA